MKNLGAFFGKKSVKDKYLKRVRAHIAADNLVRGQGWEKGKGCAVGCTYEAYDHSRAPIETGTPEWLAHAEDKLFEGMSLKKSRTWPARFLGAIKPGADLEPIRVQFICVVLKHTLKSLRKAKRYAAFPREIEVITRSELVVKQMIAAQKSGDIERISTAGVAAEAVGAAAVGMAGAAVWAAWTAAEAAAWAEWAAEEAAVWAAAAARAAAAATGRAAEGAEVYDHFADELLKLLRAAKHV